MRERSSYGRSLLSHDMRERWAQEATLCTPQQPWGYCDAVTQGREVYYVLQRPIPQGDATIACTLCCQEAGTEGTRAPVVHWQYLIEETEVEHPRILRMRLCLTHFREYVTALQRQLTIIEEAQGCTPFAKEGMNNV